MFSFLSRKWKGTVCNFSCTELVTNSVLVCICAVCCVLRASSRQGYDVKTFTVKITLQPDSGCVTGMVEIPGTFCRFLITSHADGSLCLWDLKRQKLHRVGSRALASLCPRSVGLAPWAFFPYA